MRITLSHHRFLSRASESRTQSSCPRYLVLLLILVTIQAIPVLPQVNNFTLYWRNNDIVPGPVDMAYELVEKLIVRLGDQNGDGYDDFVASTRDSMIQIYHGGNPMDTLPYLQWRFPGRVWNIEAMDWNDDGHLDLLIDYSVHDPYERIALYFGGPGILDSIREKTICCPREARPGGFGSFLHLGDFNGDGKRELYAYCQNVYGTEYNQGSILKFNIYPTPPYIDSLPTVLFTGDTLDSRWFFRQQYGDFNGDGLTDVVISSVKSSVMDSTQHHIFLGNPTFDFTVNQIIKSGAYGANRYNLDIRVLGDVDNNGKTDIMHIGKDNSFPYWFTDRISYGNFPLQLTNNVGVNTGNAGSSKAYMCGDINNDGYEDFISRAPGHNNSALYLGGHMNTLNPVMVYIGTSRTALIGVGDVNGDGADDIGALLMYTNPGGNVTSAIFEIYLGDTTLVGINDAPKPVHDDTLLQIDAHPNPFNSQTTIRFKINHDSRVTITVHNILGQEITKEVYDTKGNTELSYQLDATRLNLASGMYIVTAEATDLLGKQLSSRSIKVQFIK